MGYRLYDWVGVWYSRVLSWSMSSRHTVGRRVARQIILPKSGFQVPQTRQSGETDVYGTRIFSTHINPFLLFCSK